jgi:hypothetical protein
MAGRRESVVPLKEKNILVGQTLKKRMEVFLHDRELACGQLQPHSGMWELCTSERHVMYNYMAVWDLLRGRGDSYEAQDRFLDDTLCLWVLGRERRFRDPREAGA